MAPPLAGVRRLRNQLDVGTVGCGAPARLAPSWPPGPGGTTMSSGRSLTVGSSLAARMPRLCLP